MTDKWYEKNYRRNLVDMHIEDWDDSFMSGFDPAVYVDMLKKAEVLGAMVYANSHVGYCYWPTKAGVMHRGLKGRDILGEVFDLCHKNGMDVILYYSVIYDNWAYDHDPSWRIIDINGRGSRQQAGPAFMPGITGSRYGVCCPNSKGYRDYTAAQIGDLCANYDFESVFFDMTFWPRICYCNSCRERYARETGGEIPSVVDWGDPKWVAFQKKREEWLTEFAIFCTNQMKKHKPATSVNHQFSPMAASWQRGVTESMRAAVDYAGGDFYGGLEQQSFICKMFHSLTGSFEFHTSRCTNLGDHTTMKPAEELELHHCIAMAHNGAFLFIDAIDPAGTMNPKVYETLGKVFGKGKRYEPYLGGDLAQDAAIYFSTASKMDLKDNGKDLSKGQGLSGEMPHMKAAVGAAKILKENHIPFGVITSGSLKDTSPYKVIILPDVIFMSDEEAKKIREFVMNGGSLYASGHIPSKLLEEVLGAEYEGTTGYSVSYIAPDGDAGKQLMPGVDEKYPLTVFGPQIKVKAKNTCEVKAVITLPCTNPSDTVKFASIHSNPPGGKTAYPAIIYREYGKGRIIWISAPIEVYKHKPHNDTFVRIIRTLAADRFSFDVQGPKAVEVTLFHQPDKKRFIINVINGQELLPPVPAHNVTVKVVLNGRKAVRALLLPDEETIGFAAVGGFVCINVPTIDIFRMIALDYE